MGPDGKIVNALPDAIPPPTPPSTLRLVEGARDDVITEDEVKKAVHDHLTAGGFDVTVAWGRIRGIDIEAKHPDGRRLVIEAKAEVGKNGPQQVNYFLGMLGELLQRMGDPGATYGIALRGIGSTEASSSVCPLCPRTTRSGRLLGLARRRQGYRVNVDQS